MLSVRRPSDDCVYTFKRYAFTPLDVKSLPTPLRDNKHRIICSDSYLFAFVLADCPPMVSTYRARFNGYRVDFTSKIPSRFARKSPKTPNRPKFSFDRNSVFTFPLQHRSFCSLPRCSADCDLLLFFRVADCRSTAK